MSQHLVAGRHHGGFPAPPLIAERIFGRHAEYILYSPYWGLPPCSPTGIPHCISTQRIGRAAQVIKADILKLEEETLELEKQVLL